MSSTATCTGGRGRQLRPIQIYFSSAIEERMNRIPTPEELSSTVTRRRIPCVPEGSRARAAWCCFRFTDANEKERT